MKDRIKPRAIHELGILAKRTFHVLGLITRQRQIALASATLLMIITSLGNTSVAVLLGTLIDRPSLLLID